MVNRWVTLALLFFALTFPSVTVSTSCNSTRDRISLAFGDASGNKVCTRRLDDPRLRTFESCSSDTFQITSPCTYQICYLYLYRSGRDGWMPYDITVQGYNTNHVTFYYNVVIPAVTRYGCDHCSGTRVASLAKKSEVVQIWSPWRIVEWRPSNWTIRGNLAGIQVAVSLILSVVNRKPRLARFLVMWSVLPVVPTSTGFPLISLASDSVDHDQKPANKDSSGMVIGIVSAVVAIVVAVLVIIHCYNWGRGRGIGCPA